MIPLEQVDGLNVTEGLERCMGDRAFYQNVLLEFRASYGDMAARLARLMAAGQWKEAEDLAHAAKGTSGMLSANDLFAATSTLDASLKIAVRSGIAPPSIQQEFERFRDELARLIAGINKLDGE